MGLKPESGCKLFRGDSARLPSVFDDPTPPFPFSLLNPPVSLMNCVTWVMACNRLFVLTSPLGGLPSACTRPLPLVLRCYGGFPKAVTPMSETPGPWLELKSVAQLGTQTHEMAVIKAGPINSVGGWEACLSPLLCQH